MLCLAFRCARLSMEMQNMSDVGIKDCLTGASLGWKCLENTIKIANFIRLTISILQIFYVNQSKAEE